MSDKAEQLTRLCTNAMEDACLASDARYRARLKYELREIAAKKEVDYFLDLHEKKVRYPANENNLLVPYLLGVVKEVEIDKEPVCDYGDFPDIDTDFLPEVRDYLKNEWAIKEFGQPFVCSIGSYNTFGIKSSLQDMARVFSKPRDEITAITTSLEGKDDEGKELTWQKALDLYPDLKEYCENNPDVADAARRLLHRNKSMGKHAGGLIVSSKPLDRLVPIVLSKDGQHTSAWVEGLHGQDLGPMGLIKFDLLVITNILQIAYACKLIKERHGVRAISGLDTGGDWSDLAYLDERNAIETANRADLKGIFQFDSPGIRGLVGKGGVSNFEDLVAYTALFRPGPLGMKMHESFVARKHGKEEYERHPVLEPILGDTYYVQTYQEQVMQMLNAVGLISMDECEIVRKAISKKQEEKFKKFMEQFVDEGKVVLGWAAERVIQLWKEIESFAAYGFNRSHACAYTYVSSRLLYLKTHFPLEFFAAVLRFEDKAEKIKEYREEAEMHGVPVEGLNVNKSKVYFDIAQDNKIYIGFSNLDGVGPAVAERVVAKQPYSDLHGFLANFGTDSSVLSAMLGLRVFNQDPESDAETERLWKYYEWYKDRAKKVKDRRKRYEDGVEDFREELRGMLPAEHQHLADLSNPQGLLDLYGGGEVKIDDKESVPYKVTALVEKYRKKRERFNAGLDKDVIRPEDFKPEEVELDEGVLAICKNREAGESAYYGFLWKHPIERSPDYKPGHTLERVRTFAGRKLEIDNAPYCQLYIKAVQQRESTKTKGFFYWLLDVEDSRGEKAFVQVWADDWERWKDDLTPQGSDSLLREIQLLPPDPRWPSRYSMFSWPRHMKWKRPQDKVLDLRVMPMTTYQQGKVKNAVAN